MTPSSISQVRRLPGLCYPWPEASPPSEFTLRQGLDNTGEPGRASEQRGLAFSPETRPHRHEQPASSSHEANPGHSFHWKNKNCLILSTDIQLEFFKQIKNDIFFLSNESIQCFKPESLVLVPILPLSLCMTLSYWCHLCSVAWSCPTLCNPIDCSPPGFSVHGILQARILEWVAILLSRDLPNPGIEPRSPALQEDSLPSEPPGNALTYLGPGLFICWVADQTRHCFPVD